MTVKQVRAKLKKATAQDRWLVPSALKKFVCSNDEIIARTKKIRVSFAAVALKARRRVNGLAAR